MVEHRNLVSLSVFKQKIIRKSNVIKLTLIMSYKE